MRENVSSWLFPELSRVAKKHKYDLNRLNDLVSAIDGRLSLPGVKILLNKQLAEHHYELVGVLAEFMTRDDRVSFQTAGRTFLRKVAKAPAESEAMLRMLKRAKLGLSPYRCTVVFRNLWFNRIETAVVKHYAASAAEALDKAKESSAMRGKILKVIVREVTSDADAAEMAKAVVESVALSRDDDATEVTTTSFAEATEILMSWRSQMQPHQLVGVKVAVSWENSEVCTVCSGLSRDTASLALDVAALLKSTIDLVLDNIPIPGKTLVENQALRKAWCAQGAEAHLTQVRAECLLRDWPASAIDTNLGKER